MGKRQIGDMQPNELVVTLLLSEIAAIPLQDTSQPILYGVLAIFTLVILEIVISVIAMKSVRFRKLMSGKSVVIIKNGVVDYEAMKNVRMTALDLIELLRGQNVFDISTVAFAVLEVDGNLSVLLNSVSQPATVEDLNISKPQEELSLPVISDGKILPESLKALGLSVSDLQKQLKKQKLSKESILLMMMDRNKKTNIVKKEVRK